MTREAVPSAVIHRKAHRHLAPAPPTPHHPACFHHLKVSVKDQLCSLLYRVDRDARLRPRAPIPLDGLLVDTERDCFSGVAGTVPQQLLERGDVRERHVRLFAWI